MKGENEEQKQTLGDGETRAAPGSDESVGPVPTVTPGAGPYRRFEVGAVLLDRYVITERLGVGGQAAVYKVHDRVAGIDVALKFVPTLVGADAAAMADLRENFRLVQALKHPNIAALNTLEQDPATGEFFVVMEYVAGRDLDAWRRSFPAKKVLVDKALEVVGEIARGLDFAHAERIIHRDIKPSNVIITQAGKVKITDFGLASQIRSSFNRLSRDAFPTSGTLPYMSPEQWRGRRQDARSDVWSLAVLFYELVSGRLPFTGDDARVLREQVLNDTPERVEALSAIQNRALLTSGLAKDRDTRCASASELVAVLSGKRVPRVARRRSRRLAWLVLLLVVVAGATVLVTQLGKKPAAQRNGDRRRSPRSRAESDFARQKGIAADFWKTGATKAEALAIMDAVIADKEGKYAPEELADAHCTAITWVLDRDGEGALDDAKKRYVALSFDDRLDNLLAETAERAAGVILDYHLDRASTAADYAAKIKEIEHFRAWAGLMSVKPQEALDEAATRITTLKREAEQQFETGLKRASDFLANDDFDGAERELEALAASILDDTRAAQERQKNELSTRLDAQRAQYEEFTTALSRAKSVLEATAPPAADITGAEAQLSTIAKDGTHHYRKGAQSKLTELTQRRRTLAAKYVADGDTAARRGDCEGWNAALAAYREAQKYLPNDTDIEDKLAEARKNALPGKDLDKIADAKEREAVVEAFDTLPAGKWTVEARHVDVAENMKPHKKWIAYFTHKGTGVEFVYVPAGRFQMGSPSSEDGRYGDEDQHWVTITEPFLMSATEVTNAQYLRYFPSHDSKSYKGHSLNGDKRPVVYVSWNDAVAFCRKLGGDLGGGLKCRLPTEAEWEYACRAGSSTAYSWGDRFVGTWLNFADKNTGFSWRDKSVDDGYGVTAPVGQYPANAWGLYDMHGNVWEWCEDWYDEDYYGRREENDPQGPSTGNVRVLRGGSWYFFPSGCRSANRARYSPADPISSYGFRVVVSLR